MRYDSSTVAVGYVRVSSDSQSENASLPNQRKAIEKYCERAGLQIFGIFEDVQSGESAVNRDGLQNALKTITAGLADSLVVFKYDRLSRNVLDAEGIKEELRKSGKRLISATEQIEVGSHDGNMMYQMKSIFAAYEKKQIKKRCAMGQRKKKERGGYHAGAPLFGWDAIGRELVVNEGQQNIIKEIFDRRAAGQSLAEVAFALNARGVKTKRGGTWSPGTVQRIAEDFPELLEARGLTPDWMRPVLARKAGG
jgi:site-specific DNA recombinase